jgi:ABC-type microcin C transport system duplicated ATPase subunit YejF
LVLAAAAGRLEAAEPAASTSSNVPIAFEIKTQLLSKALNDFSAVTRIEVLVDASNTVGLYSVGIQGMMTPSRALAMPSNGQIGQKNPRSGML